MTEMSLVADPSQADRQEWDDIEDVARELFHVWSGDGDLNWAKAAWQALARAGMTAYTTEAERTACMARLLGLSAMSREFYVYAFDEGSSGEWREAITTELVGDYPLLDAFTLGQLAERLGMDVDNPSLYESEPPATTFVILELMEREYQDVVDALMEQWGQNAFFTSLWVSAGIGYDLYDDEDQDKEDENAPVTLGQINRVMNDDVTYSTGRAYSWFTDGLRL
jgi:hypothetical protein